MFNQNKITGSHPPCHVSPCYGIVSVSVKGCKPKETFIAPRVRSLIKCSTNSRFGVEVNPIVAFIAFSLIQQQQ